MKFGVVEELGQEQQDVALVCKVFRISRSGYYEWLNRPQSARTLGNLNLEKGIRKMWLDSDKTYGSPRIHRELKRKGHHVGRNRVAKVMRENAMTGVGRKRFKVVTTDSKHDLPIAARVFKVEEASIQVTHPNQYWGGDITYVPTSEGWLYLAVFIDLFTRKVVGHNSGSTMETELVLEAFSMAVQKQGIELGKSLVVHTDRGSQYAADAFRTRLAAHQITPSMSRKGNCYDNAFVETFFRSLKVELVYRRKFKTREEAKSAIFQYIEVWYNRNRIHSSLDYVTPVEYENQTLKSA